MKSLPEKYRPKSWNEVIGQEKVIKQIESLRERGGLGGRAYWISGASGTGKTSIARLIAAEVADDYETIELSDPSELTAEVIALARRAMQFRPFGKGCCFILNEAHGASNALVRKLLGLTETVPDWITWVFTTTNSGQDKLFEDCDDASPLLSRCTKLELSRRDLAEPFAARVREIAQAEGLDGQPIGKYLRLLKECRNNFRAALQAVESGVMVDGGAS